MEIIDGTSSVFLDSICFLLVASGAGAGLATHDATPHAIRKIDCLLLGHVRWEVDKAGEFGNGSTFHLLHVTLELRRNWWFQRYTLAL